MAQHFPDAYRYLSKLSPTPLVPVALYPGSPTIWCKLEFLSPSGSTKDRVARFILERAWESGALRPGDLVVEASSGSMSIAMALTCAKLGLRFRAVMPEGVSNERVWMIKAFGAEVVTTPGELGIHGAIERAERMGQQEGAFLPRQFSNEANIEAHRLGTAREIVEQLPGGNIDAIVSGVGSGGTLMGLYLGLSEMGSSITPVVTRPINSKRSSRFSDRVPGVADGVSTIFREEHLPGLMTIEVEDDFALETARDLARAGFPVGPSSGLNYRAALIAAERISQPSIHVVTIFPDRMERYFSTELFAPHLDEAL